MENKLAVGVIPDGNRTWAKNEALNPQKGYHYGARSAVEVVKTALELGTVGRLVFFLLSHENIERRPDKQIRAIIGAAEEVLEQICKLPKISIQFVGEQSEPEIARLTKKYTTAGSGMHVDLLAVYSATWDLSSRPLGSMSIPPLNAIIRTSGQARLSGFLPWQSAYAQFLFTNTLWPNFTGEEFSKLLATYDEIRKHTATGE